MTETRRTTTAEARRVGDAIGVDWSRFDLEQFRAGMDLYFERHDGEAATVEQFVQCFADVSGREKISTELLPPNPNELLITCVNAAGRNEVIGSSPMATSAEANPGLGGNCCRRNASTHTTASIAPLAASAWPKIRFVLEKGGTRSPNNSFKAFVSETSLSRVPVPWALM